MTNKHHRSERVEDYAAPVLLIYSQSDEIVPAYQSERMRRALKEAGKDVELLKIDGDDHYLSSGETRPQALKATAFIRRAPIGRWRFVQDRRTTPKPRTRNPGLRRSPTVSSNSSSDLHPHAPKPGVWILATRRVSLLRVALPQSTVTCRSIVIR